MVDAVEDAEWEACTVAPEPGAVYHVFSPSQIETASACQRKWGFGRIAREPKPDNASASLGSEVHTELENYEAGKPLDFRHPRDAGYIAASGLHFLPNPDMTGLSDEEVARRARDIKIETEFRFQSARTNFVWNGRKDLELADSRDIPDLTLACNECAGSEGTFCCTSCDGSGRVPITDASAAPAVLDHKSTSSLRWMKTAEDLTWDIQANVYAYALMVARRVETVDLVWVYYQTKGAKTAKRTHLRVHWPHAKRAFALIEDMARPLAKAIDRAPDHAEGPPDLRGYVRTLKANPSACSMYGGCPYQSVCQLSLQERMVASMSDSSFFDSLANRAAAQDGGTPPVVMSDRDVPAPTGLPAWMTSAAPSTPVMTPMPSFTPTVATDAPINPPEVAAPAPVVDLTTSGRIDTSAPNTSVAPVSEAEDKPKTSGKRGRPAGSKNKPKDPTGADAMAHTGAKSIEERALSEETGAVTAKELEAEVAKHTGKIYPEGTPNVPAERVLPKDAYEAAIANASAELEAEKVKPTSTIVNNHMVVTVDASEIKKIVDEEVAHMMGEISEDPDAFHLYVDCMPLGIPTVDASEYITRAKLKIASQVVPDGKGGTITYPDYRYMPFGHGSAALVAAVIEQIESAPPAHLTLDTRTPEGTLLLSDLTARADFTVRGFR